MLQTPTVHSGRDVRHHQGYKLTETVIGFRKVAEILVDDSNVVDNYELEKRRV